MVSAAIAIVVLVLVFVAGSNQVFDTTPECVEFRYYESDMLYDCRGSLTASVVGEFPEFIDVDVYCRPYEAIPSPHDIEELMLMSPKDRPSEAVGFFAHDLTAIVNPIAVFDASDDPYLVCEARKMGLDSVLHFADCNEFDDVGICKASQIEWRLNAAFDGAERFQTSKNRWIVISTDEFSHLELKWVG